MSKYTDTDMIEHLEAINRRTECSGCCVLRVNLLGWSLKSVAWGAETTVREAISLHMDERK